MKKHIPNFITSLNIICGFLSILFVFQSNLVMASVMVFMALFFDYLDGFIARLLNAKSELGKELDSLGDVISFGVAPGIIMAWLIAKANGVEGLSVLGESDAFVQAKVLFSVLIPVFAALRLARFNVYQSMSSDFIGLPVPSSAIFYVSLPLILIFEPQGLFSTVFVNNNLFFLISIVVLSLLNVSRIKMFSFKLKTSEKNTNVIYQIILLFFGVILIFSFRFQAIPIIIISYVLLSVIKQVMDK